MHWIYLIHEFHNLSWITEINELFHDILIYWDAPVFSLFPLKIVFKSCDLTAFSSDFTYILSLCLAILHLYLVNPFSLKEYKKKKSNWLFSYNYKFTSRNSGFSLNSEFTFRNYFFCHRIKNYKGNCGFLPHNSDSFFSQNWDFIYLNSDFFLIIVLRSML